MSVGEHDSLDLCTSNLGIYKGPDLKYASLEFNINVII